MNRKQVTDVCERQTFLSYAGEEGVRLEDVRSNAYLLKPGAESEA